MTKSKGLDAVGCRACNNEDTSCTSTQHVLAICGGLTVFCMLARKLEYIFSLETAETFEDLCSAPRFTLG